MQLCCAMFALFPWARFFPSRPFDKLVLWKRFIMLDSLPTDNGISIRLRLIHGMVVVDGWLVVMH